MKFYPSLFLGWLTSGIYLSPSTWEFTTSEGAKFDVVVAAVGKGAFYVKGSTDPDQIVYELRYVGMGVTTSEESCSIRYRLVMALDGLGLSIHTYWIRMPPGTQIKPTGPRPDSC